MKKNKKNMLLFGASSDVGYEIVNELSSSYTIYGTKYKGNTFGLNQELTCDIRKLEDIDAVINKIPALDVVVFSSFPEILNDSKDFEGYLKAEPFLRGYMYAITQIITKKLNHSGKIINILGQSVDHGLVGAPYMGMIFAAINNFSKAVNAKYGRKGEFAIYDLLMGPIDTKMWDRVPLQVVQDNKYKTNSFIKPSIVASYVAQILKHAIGPTKIVLDGFYSLPNKV
jgi:short-subunit dehydrogenase